MYTSYIGKKFLEYYKEEYSKPQNYSAEQFFDEVMFPIFFDDERHLMHVGNSPFFQKVSDADKELHGTRTKAQLARFKKKILSGDFGGDILVGSGSSDSSATTSGQISDLKIIQVSEEAYLSWIGQALAVSVKGGIANLIDKREILLLLYQGWSLYGEFIKQTPGLKDKQIETWNGNYLKQMLNAGNCEFNASSVEVEITLGKLAIQTIQWTELIFELSKKYKNDTIFSYVYVLSQTNTTVGMISFFLNEIYELYELRDMIFINEKDTVLSDNQIERLLPFYSFKQACMQGTIGLKSIEPRGLRNYLPKGSFDYSKGNDINIQKEDNFPIYKLWIIAMLNKKELLDLSREFAKLLKNSVEKKQTSEGRAKSTQQQFVKDIFDSKTSKQFVDNITNLVDNANSDILRKMAEEAILMPRDNFPLFITLIKFEYSILNNKE
ncbi:MAG: hypothetical protein KIT33_00370 [Candidatus Kapabacteria bacterium]|nr:hypothetical protein [Ignavibacteriota bacterium]MCW5883402.1 hypothetical protein [Candidatus Kapabacteria bacterium]